MSDLMICKYAKCQKYLLDPILLSCSSNVCKSHLDDELLKHEIIKNEHFICFVCENEKHISHRTRFISNTLVAKMIELNMHLNKKEKIVAVSLNKLKKDLERFEFLVQDPENFICEHISSIRNKVNIERERLIDEINTVSDAMLLKLDKYKDQCHKNLFRLKDLNEQHKIHVAMASNDIARMKEELRIPNIEMKRLDELYHASNQLINDTERRYLDYKRNLLLNKELNMNIIKTKFDQQFFIQMNSINNFSSNITTQSQFFDLAKLCKISSQSQFIMLYQATRDGFSADSFHSNCDGIPNTLTLIKVKGNSNIFGGFCNASWDTTSQYKKDSKAFIFSTVNNNNCPLKINVTKPSHAIYCASGYGPTFGDGHDIYISNDSNKNQESYSNLGHGYKDSLYIYQTTKIKHFLAGSKYFGVEEIEVYHVI